MKAHVCSLKKILFQGEILSMTCNTSNGEITVLDHHRPLISVIQNGVMRILDREHKEHFVQAKSGFLEVRPDNEVRMIVEEANSN